MKKLGFKDNNLNELLAKSIFIDLSDKIVKISKKMVEDLENTKGELKNDEDTIRNYFINEYLDNLKYRQEYGLSEFLFMPGSEEIGKGKDPKKYGILDIKIVIQEMTFHNPEAYFIIECKRLDGSNSLNNEYIKNGVRRFISDESYYTTFSNRNYMMGFIVRDLNIEDLICKINKVQKGTKDINILKDLCSTEIKELYESQYLHQEKEKTLNHIFINLSKSISIKETN